MLTVMRDARSIVVAQLSFIGDMIFTTPLLAGLGELWPDAPITVVGRPSALGVLDGFPGVSGTIPYDKDDREKGPGSLLAIGLALFERRRQDTDPNLHASRRRVERALEAIRGAANATEAEAATQLSDALRRLLAEIPEGRSAELDAFLGD